MPGFPTLDKTIQQTPFGQLHHNNDCVINALEPIQRQEKRVPNFANAPEGAEVLFGSRVGDVPVNDFHSLGQAARRGRMPDLTESPGAQAPDQNVSGKGLSAFGYAKRHLNTQLERLAKELAL